MNKSTPFFILISCLGVLFFLFFFRPIETEDVWWHLSAGKWIMEHGQVPHTDPFPVAAEQNPWFCVHWLGSIILYLTSQIEGVAGLKIFRSLFFMAVIAVFLRYSWRRIPHVFSIILALLLALALGNRVLLRPDIFNFIFIQLFLVVLFNYEKNPDPRKLFFLPAIGILWANIHLGSFIYGGAIIFIFLLSAVAKVLEGGPKKPARDLFFLSLSYLGVFVMTPYGVEGFLYFFKVFLLPGFIGFYKTSNAVSESKSPAYMFLSFDYFYFLILFALGLVTLIFNRRKNFTLVLLFIFSFFMFIYMARNCVFFALAVVYIITEILPSVNFKLDKILVKTAGIVLIIGLMLSLVSEAWRFNSPHLFYKNQFLAGLRAEDDFFSRASINVLKENKISGTVFNADFLGGLMLWSAYPSLKPFLDGRFLSQERFDGFVQTLKDPEEGWPALEAKYRFKALMLNVHNPIFNKFIQYISARPQAWQLIAIEGPLAVYVQRNAFQLPPALDRFEDELKVVMSSLEEEKRLEQMTITKADIFKKSFVKSMVRADLFTEGQTMLGLGFRAAAVKTLIKALQVSDGAVGPL